MGSNMEGCVPGPEVEDISTIRILLAEAVTWLSNCERPREGMSRRMKGKVGGSAGEGQLQGVGVKA